MNYSPTVNRRRSNHARSNVRRPALLKLALAVVLAGTGLFFLMRPNGSGRVQAAAAALTVSISDAPSVVEGNPTPTPSATPTPSPSPVATFTVSLSAPNPDPSPVTVDYTPASGTASAGSDFDSNGGTVSFAQNEQTKTISIPINPDTTPEGDETFFVNLSNPQGALTIADGQGQTTIVDDDPGGIFAFAQPSFSVNEGDGVATITVKRTGSLVGTVTVNFNTFDLTAVAGRDYGNTGGTLTFGPGETTKTFDVPIIDDTITETTESLGLSLSGATNGATVDGSGGSASLVIFDNETASDFFAVTNSNKLLRFRSNTPGTVTTIGTITGLQPGEQVVAIDVRPATGQLYALGKLGSTGRLYVINQTTAAATLVAALAPDPSDSTSPYTALSGTAFDVDFNPVADRLRVVSDADQNLRVNPSTGLVTTDTNLAYIANDSNFGANPNVTAAAYTNSFAGAALTTLYVIDSNLDVLAIQDPPNTGHLDAITSQLRDTSSSPVNTTELTGLDSRASDNALFASLTAPGDSTSKLALIAFDRFGNVVVGFVDTIGGGELIRDIAAAPTGTFQFSSATATVSEGGGKASLTVTRTGDTTGTSSVECVTSDGTATQKGDYTITISRLTFAPGETSKPCEILIVDDSFAEAAETFTASLQNPTANFTPGTTGSVTVTITDNDAVTGANPIDNSSFFVRQHYLDFLGREPDTAGLNFWVNGIESCGANAGCRDVKRIDTSAAFFLAIEFQETGFYAIRVQAAAFRKHSDEATTRMSYTEFIRDARQVGEGVVIGQPGAEARLDQNKTAYALRIVTSPEFIQTTSPTLSGESYVITLFQRAGVFDETDAEVQAGVDALGIGDTAGRAAALRSVADSASVRRAHFNSAFVLMQYFGYLRRNPTDAPDTDDSGYQFWLNKLESFDGDYRQAEMVRAFILSDEYRKRFGP
ncbi:MAG TPA: DUF4394 domain-containing protein [Pyrinomonadaceae bacterium]|nr:DUF4394 domain-containing protein [Pyrinomonadaceae bacterium]